MGIIIDIPDITKKRLCFDIWEQSHGKLRNAYSSQSQESQNENILWESFRRGDMETLKKLITHSDPNTQDDMGKSLLQACIQSNHTSAVETLCNCPSININQKDSVGRNVLFYCLDCPPMCIKGRTLSVFDYLVEKGAEINSDNFQRTLLHEWYPEREDENMYNDERRAHILSVKKITAHISLGCKDYKGQTPLHLAVLKQKIFKARKLLEAGSDPHATDANGLSPFFLAKRDSYIYKLLTEFHTDPKKSGDDPKVPQEKQSAYFSKMFPIDHRIIYSIHTLFKQRYPLPSEDIFRANYDTSVQISADQRFKDEFRLFRQFVMEFMEDLSRVIAHDDPLFDFKPTLSGSCSERTKVVEMNEADVLCRFQHPAWKDLLLTNYEKDNFTYMKFEGEELARTHPDLFKQTCLSAHGLLKRFYGLVRKHIAGVLKRHKYLYIIDVHIILPQECVICPLDLVWCGEMLTWQEFSLDIVPAIPVSTTQLPGELKHQDFVHDPVVVPKWNAGLIKKEYANEAFQLGLASTEKDMFDAMPTTLRQGYKLAKVIVHDCMLIDGIAAGDSVSTFMLKCQAFESFTAMPDFEKKMKGLTPRDLMDDEQQIPVEVIQCADEIFSRLEKCMESHHLESFFLFGGVIC